MLHTITFVTLFLIAGQGSAEVFASIKQKLAPSIFASLSQALDRASSRPADQQAYSRYAELDASLVLDCPPYKPDQQGLGCYVYFAQDSTTNLGELRFLIRKPVEKALLEKARIRLQTKLAETDVNSTR